MTVQQLRDNASSWEISEWMAYERWETEDERQRTSDPRNRGLGGPRPDGT